MKKFLAILAAAIINTPVLFAGGHVNIPIDHLVDGILHRHWAKNHPTTAL